jgi:hypothetical protein
MKKTVYAAILGIGVVLGILVGASWPGTVVQAQAAWQCRSWTIEERGDAAVVGTWLGTAKTFQMTSAGLPAPDSRLVSASNRNCSPRQGVIVIGWLRIELPLAQRLLA